MRHTYTPVEFVEFQQKVMNQVDNPDITVSRSGNEYSVEFPNKSPYRSIHQEAHDPKGAIGSELRKMKFKRFESQNDVSENEEVRNPTNVDNSKSLFDLTVEIDIEIDEIVVFGNGSIVKVPILSW